VSKKAPLVCRLGRRKHLAELPPSTSCNCVPLVVFQFRLLALSPARKRAPSKSRSCVNLQPGACSKGANSNSVCSGPIGRRSSSGLMKIWLAENCIASQLLGDVQADNCERPAQGKGLMWVFRIKNKGTAWARYHSHHGSPTTLALIGREALACVGKSSRYELE